MQAHQQSYYSAKQPNRLKLMYDRALNQSRTSLTTNSSRASRIVRKRDSNFSAALARSKSKNKEDECNTSFQQYLSRQSKLMGRDNSEQLQNEANTGVGEYPMTERIQRVNGSMPVSLSESISTIQLSRTTMIQRGDRYIQPRSNIIPSQAPAEQKQKKREPTPVKSKKQLTSAIQSIDSKKESSQIFELELRINGLEDALTLQKKLKEKNYYLAQEANKDVQNLKQVLSKIQMHNKILENEKKLSDQKIIFLQKTVMESQNNLTTAQNNLNKLRQTIKENRLNQLQSQLKKAQKINQSLKQTNESSAKLICNLQQKLKLTIKQLDELKKHGSIEAIAAKQSMKELYLQNQVDKIKSQYEKLKNLIRSEKQSFLEQKVKEQQIRIFELKQEIKVLQVKIHVLESCKSKDIAEIKQKNETQMKSLRVKYSKMVVELKTKNKVASSLSSTPANTNATKSRQTNSKSRSPSPKKANLYDIACRCSSTAQPSSTSPTAITNNITNNYIYGGTNYGGTCNTVYQKPTSAEINTRGGSFGTRIVSSTISSFRLDDNFDLELSPQ